MKKLIYIAALLLASAVLYAQNVVAILDFDTESNDIQSKMSMMSDIFRVEMAKSSNIEVVDRKHTQEVINELSIQMSSLTRDNNVKSIGQMLNADYVVIGNVAKIVDDAEIQTQSVTKNVEEDKGLIGKITGSTRNRRVTEEKEVTVQDSNINVVVQMIDVESAKVIATSRICFKKWTEYDTEVRTLVKPLVNNMTFSAKSNKENFQSFAGKWETEVVESGINNVYTFEFLENYMCSVTLTSTDKKGNTTTVSKRGRYNYKDGILSFNINMPNAQIKHVQEIKWKTMVSMSADKKMFSAIVPVNSNSGAVKIKADFYKIE